MSTLSDNQVTVYEEPVHERIRKFLRIEMLFNRINYLKDKESQHENYSAAVALTELYEMLTRGLSCDFLFRCCSSCALFSSNLRALLS